MNLNNLLTGTKILEKTKSKYNGVIYVYQDLTWGITFKVDGLTQSGGIIKNIWQKTLKKIITVKPQIDSCLILGLGGGSVAKLVSQYWVNSKVVGVDIDPKIVNLGKKYLGLDKIKLRVEIGDADEYVSLEKDKYDLIIIDLYCGNDFPSKFEDEKFILKVKSLLNTNGIAVFNRLYGGDKRPAAVKFGALLEKNFPKVDYIYPQANLELICYTQGA